MMRTILSTALIALGIAVLGLPVPDGYAQTASSQMAKQCETAQAACEKNCESQFRTAPEKKVSCTKDTCGVQYQACLNKAGAQTPAGTKQNTTVPTPRDPKMPAKDKMN